MVKRALLFCDQDDRAEDSRAKTRITLRPLMTERVQEYFRTSLALLVTESFGERKS